MAQTDIRILGIAPYEGMAAAMERTAGDAYPQVRLEVFTADLEEGAALVRAMPPDSYDCIISRGGTAELIRQVTDIPVVEIQVSVYDVLRTIKLAENYTDLYAIVGFPSITRAAHIVCDLLRINVDILTVHSAEEVSSTLSRLRQGGYRMVVCDMITHTVARRMELDAFLITSGEESLHAAFERALALGMSFRRLREENQFLRGAVRDGARVVVLDAGGALYRAAPADPPEEELAVLRQKIPEIPPNSPLQFYQSMGRMLHQVTAQAVTVGQRRYFVFHCLEARIPLRAGHAGIRFYSRGECQYLLEDDLYSLSGVPGRLSLSTVAFVRQPVMLAGEPGTGHDQTARMLYLQGPLRNRSFVLLDCEVLNEKSWSFLLNHYGSPLNAAGNTIYFRYVEAVPQEYAARLLSAIQETGLARRQRLLFSCRCAEDRPLPEFCQRLISALGCLFLRLPALRTRPDEIPSLASLYLSSLNLELGKQISGFDPSAIERLRRYQWPQNYTQFERILRELVIRTDSVYITGNAAAELLAKERSIVFSGGRASLVLEDRTLEEIITDSILQVLAAHGGNRTAAARQLGISRSTLWRYLSRLES